MQGPVRMRNLVRGMAAVQTDQGHVVLELRGGSELDLEDHITNIPRSQGISGSEGALAWSSERKVTNPVK